MNTFNQSDFSMEILGKLAGTRFNEIHNLTLRFLHRWLVFTLFPRKDMRSVTIAELYSQWFIRLIFPHV